MAAPPSLRRGAHTHWKKLEFFDKKDWSQERPEVSNQELPPEIQNPLENFNVYACGAGNGTLIFGDNEGRVRYFRTNLQPKEFHSHGIGIEFIVKNAHDNRVLVVGYDEHPNGQPWTKMKIWSLQPQASGPKAKLRTEIPVFNNRDFLEEVSRSIEEVFGGVHSFDENDFFRILNQAGVNLKKQACKRIFQGLNDTSSRTIQIMEVRIGLVRPEMDDFRNALFDAGIYYQRRLYAVVGFIPRSELTEDFIRDIKEKVLIGHECLLCRRRDGQIILGFGRALQEPDMEEITDKIRKFTNRFNLRLEQKSFDNIRNEITCVSVTQNFSTIALGFSNGAVALYETTNGGIYHFRLLRPKGEKVTGLQFIYDFARQQDYLYVVDIECVRCYAIFPSSTDFICLDGSAGCSQLNCTAINSEYRLLLARDSKIDYFDVDTQQGCDIFDGFNKMLRTFRDYIIHCTLPHKGKYDSTLDLAQDNRWTVTVYSRKKDEKGKFVAYRGTAVNVVDVIADNTTDNWRSIFLICRDKRGSKIIQLHEKPTKQKLQWLLDGRFRKERFDRAIAVAKDEGCEPSIIHDIHRKYGDQLYEKGDFETAMEKYILTIGSDRVEPSYVIQKYLDGQKIKSLTQYLEALHHQGVSNADHTTLLLNCYTKEKNLKKLSAFVRGGDENKFEIETAIRVCRQAGVFDDALYLAKEHNKHADYLDMLLELARKEKDEETQQRIMEDALEYVKLLDFKDKIYNMKLHGKKFMQHCPESTTDLLIEVCTSSVSVAGNHGGAQILNANSDDFIHLYVENDDELRRFLELVIEKGTRTQQHTYHTLLELYLREYQRGVSCSPHEKNIKEIRGKIMVLLKNNKKKFDLYQALVLAKMYGFELGVLWLYEQLHMYAEYIQHHTYSDDPDNSAKKIMQLCRRKSGQNQIPEIWVQAFIYFSQREDDCSKQLKQVLQKIQEYNLMPPLRVIQTLAKNPRLQLSVCKEYLIGILDDQQKKITQDEQAISGYTHDIDHMKTEIDKMKNNAQQFSNTKCDHCQLNLELPAVHYLCKHSYHSRCQGDVEDTCVICAHKFEKVQGMQDNMRQEDGDKLHENFSKKIKKSADPFNTIAEYFGRGVLNH